MRIRPILVATAAGLVALTAERAHAIDAQYAAAATCTWPSAVHVFASPTSDHPAGFDEDEFGECSGVYVGNHIVLTAGHCIAYTDDVHIVFGEDVDAPAWTDLVPTCAAHPDGDWVWMDSPTEDGWGYTGTDLAYCKLSGGHPAPPYVPVMVPNGCEAQYIRHLLFDAGASPFGTAINYVASGNESASDPSPIGTKRVAASTVLFEDYYGEEGLVIMSLQPGQEGGENSATVAVRDGDSGGAVFFPLLNGSWRTIGIINGLARPFYDLDGSGQVHRLAVTSNSVPRHLKWIENSSANDITPCHSWVANKWSWVGGAGCGGDFDTSPGNASSAWPGCASSTVSSSTECSGWTPPFPDNKTAPTVAEMTLEFAISGGGSPFGDELFGKDKLVQWIGTVANDSLTSTTRDANEIFGGRGNDSLFAGIGADETHGGVGNDLIAGGSENDILVPGRGLDFVQGDAGNDKIVIRGTCEIVAGETIDGGSGTDVLYTPVSLSVLSGMGVSVSSIETVVINHADLNVATCQTFTQAGPAFP